MINKTENNYIFIDTETGGVDPNKHSLLSIGICVWNMEDGIVDKKEIYVKSSNYIVTKHAKTMNKFIEEEHNLNAIEQKLVIKELIAFCRKYIPEPYAIPIIGHNIQFDVSFLKVLFKSNNKSFNQYFSHRYIDTYSVFKTYVLAGIIKEEIDSSSDAFSYFGIKVKGRHSALGDCVATVELYEKLIELIKQK